MNHNIDKYITKRIADLNWQDKSLVEKSGLSKGQISKLKNGSIEKLSAETFYLLVTAFKDSFSTAISFTYPNLKDYKLKKYVQKNRNAFGSIMRELEVSVNSIEEISAKTGISEVRLSELYYRKGALEAFELILIEKAVGGKLGELFEKLYGKR